MDFDGFSEPRPSMFPPMVDVRPNRKWDVLRSDDALKAKKFNDVLAKMMSEGELEPGTGKTTKSTFAPQSAAEKEMQKTGAEIIATRQIQGLYEGMGGFLPQNIVAAVEQTQNKFNFENPKSKDYVYFADKLKTPFYKPNKDMEDSILNSEFINSATSIPGAGNTLPHNANLLFGIGSNPFKKEDKKNYQTFEDDALYSVMHKESMSPRRVLQKLDPSFWDKINQDVTTIQNTRVPSDNPNYSSFKNPNEAQDDHDLNWKDAPDPFTDNGDIKTFDINANYHTIVMSQLWRGWGDAQVFSFVNRAWEARTRVENVLRTILGRSSDLPGVPTKVTSTESATDGSQSTVSSTVTHASATVTSDTNASTEQAAQIADTAAKEDKSLAKVDAWWNAVGNKLPEAMILPFGMLSALTPAMVEMMDWGNWGDAAAQENASEFKDKTGFREKMIDGYLNQTYNQYIFSKFKSQLPIRLNDLPFDTKPEMDAVWNKLVSAGFITSDGYVTAKFNPKDPDFDMKLGFSADKEAQIRSLLRETAVGEFSLEVQDKTKINDRKRSDIQMTGSDGVSRSLTDVVDMVNKGDNALEKINNARVAYDYFMSMYQTMTGMTNDGTLNDGKVKYTKTGETISVPVYSQGSWKSWEVTGKDSGQWKEETGAITLKFQSVEEAEAFKNRVQMMMALLEPVLGTFGAQKDMQNANPLPILTDNALMTDTTQIIDETDSRFRVRTDTPFTKNFFESDSWKTISKSLSEKTIGSIMLKISERSQGNAMLRMAHERKVNDYDDRKEEFEETEIQRMIKENEEKKVQQEEQIKAENRRQEERARMEQEDKMRAEQSRQQQRAQEAAQAESE